MSPSASFLPLGGLGPEFPTEGFARFLRRHGLRLRLTMQRTGIPKELPIQMKYSLALAVMLASGMVLSATAQTPAVSAATSPATAPVGPSKIAVVAFQVAVAQTNEGQRNFADLQKKYDPKRQQLKAQSDEIDTLTKQLQTQNASLSESERTARATAIDTKKKQLDRDFQDTQSDFQQEMQDLYNTLASKVYDVMQSYAEKEGYTVVLDVGQQQSPVLFASNTTNITKQVIDAYNLKSGVPAPPPSADTDAPKPAAPARKPASH
jgi:Skp family chaperone for outer membrane proteins